MTQRTKPLYCQYKGCYRELYSVLPHAKWCPEHKAARNRERTREAARVKAKKAKAEALKTFRICERPLCNKKFTGRPWGHFCDDHRKLSGKCHKPFKKESAIVISGTKLPPIKVRVLPAVALAMMSTEQTLRILNEWTKGKVNFL